MLPTRDDRNRPVRLHPRGFIATGEGPGSGSRVRSALRILRALFSRPILLLASISGAILLAALGAANFGPIVIALILASPVAATFITLLAMSIVSTGEWFRRETLIVKSLMLRELRCPSCDYDLTGVEPSADSCTVCPECSAAWRLDSPKYDPTPRTVRIPAPPPPPTDDPPTLE